VGEESYILEAYKLNYKFHSSNAYTAIVPEVVLQPLLNYLFVSEVTHSRPIRLLGEPLYAVYIVGDEHDVSRVKGFLKELSSELGLQDIELKSAGPVDALDDGVKADMAYRATRQYIYKRLGFRRGSGQKLYSVSSIVKSYDVLNVHRAYVTGSDIINGYGYMFIDAARKLEFTATLKDLEARIQDIVSRVQWVKIKDSSISFYIEPGIDFKKLGYPRDKVVKTLRYIAKSRDTPVDPEKLSFSDNDVVALTPKSTRLLRELHVRGYTTTIGGKEVLFLPKNVLVPVASMDNISAVLHKSIELRIAPTARHKEIADLVQKLSSGIEVGAAFVALDPQPLRVAVEKIPLDKLYISIEGSDDKGVRGVAFTWNPYKLLKRAAGKLSIYILCDESDKVSRSIADKFYEVLHKQLNVTPQLLEVDFSNIEDFAEFIAKNVKKAGKLGVVLVIGSSAIGIEEDRELRNAVEKAFRFKGLFCWYISIIVRGRKEGKKLVDERSLLSKLHVVMKELVIRLSLFSHKLQPLQLTASSGIAELFDVVAATDATVIDMERGQLRVGAVLMLMNVSRGDYTIETLVEYSTLGEDAVLAKSVRKALNLVNQSPLLIYINRTRPEALLSYLQEDEAKELLDRAVIVGASKTHTYSRMLKTLEDQFANPEPTTYCHLYTKELKELKSVKAKISKYLAVTTMAQREEAEGKLTVKPTLLTIIMNEKLWSPENIDKVLRYTITLCILNNTSTWIHSLPWPLHRVDKILKTAHRLAQTKKEILSILQNKDIIKTL
jgi:hypothetical protein